MNSGETGIYWNVGYDSSHALFAVLENILIHSQKGKIKHIIMHKCVYLQYCT